MGVESRSPPPASRRLRLAGRSLPGQRQLLAQAHCDPRLSLYIALFAYPFLACPSLFFSPALSLVSFSRIFPHGVSPVFFTSFAPPVLFSRVTLAVSLLHPWLWSRALAEIQRESVHHDSSRLPSYLLGWDSLCSLGISRRVMNFFSSYFPCPRFPVFPCSFCFLSKTPSPPSLSLSLSLFFCHTFFPSFLLSPIFSYITAGDSRWLLGFQSSSRSSIDSGRFDSVLSSVSTLSRSSMLARNRGH